MATLAEFGIEIGAVPGFLWSMVVFYLMVIERSASVIIQSVAPAVVR